MLRFSLLRSTVATARSFSPLLPSISSVSLLRSTVATARSFSPLLPSISSVLGNSVVLESKRGLTGSLLVILELE